MKTQMIKAVIGMFAILSVAIILLGNYSDAKHQQELTKTQSDITYHTVGLYRNIKFEGLDSIRLDTINKKSWSDLMEILLVLQIDSLNFYEIHVHSSSRDFDFYSNSRTLVKAKLIRDFLVNHGIQEDRIEPIGLESRYLICPNPQSPIDRWINRRILLIQKK